MLYFEIVALTLSSIVFVKHFLQSLSPEYGLEKNASFFLHTVQTVGAILIGLSTNLQQRLETIEEPLYILNCHAFLAPFFLGDKPY
jgi:hypothetical protein